MRSSIALLVSVIASAQAKAPAAPSVRQVSADLEALKAKVEDAQKAGAELEATRQALADVEARLVRLQSEVDGLSRRYAADADWQRELTRLDLQLTVLRQRVSEMSERAWREEQTERELMGPVLRTADGRFQMKWGGRLQFRHEARFESPESGESGTALSSFLVRQAKLSSGGHVWSEALGYRMQVDFTRELPLEDYYLEYRRWPALQARFGQFKVPFVRQRMISAGRLQFPDRSVASEAFDMDRDIGLMLLGESWGGWNGKIEWQAAALNGGGENRLNDNIDYLYVLRLAISPWGAVPMSEGDMEDSATPKVSVGGALAYNLLPTDITARTDGDEALADQDRDGVVDNVSVLSLGVELAARWRGVSLQGEYFWRREDPGAEEIGPDRTFEGVYVQAGYFIIPRRFEAAARYAFAEPHYYGQVMEQRQMLPESVREHAVVLSYSRFGHSLKLQGEYAYLLEDDVGAPGEASTVFDRKNHRVRMQLQVDF